MYGLLCRSERLYDMAPIRTGANLCVREAASLETKIRVPGYVASEHGPNTYTYTVWAGDRPTYGKSSQTHVAWGTLGLLAFVYGSDA